MWKQKCSVSLVKVYGTLECEVELLEGGKKMNKCIYSKTNEVGL